MGGHFHGLMLWLVIPTSAIGFYPRSLESIAEYDRNALGVFGVALITGAALWGDGQWPGWAESGLTLFGSLVLVGAHWINFQEVRRVHVHVHR
ncbi:MAG: hypothetical protein CM1200mP36_08860 [Gammaproteobacteria bacterium]|nr:MAG: hypothetical protein CM1200mP36_08860 [Gammaproteobacteria bacterium]